MSTKFVRLELVEKLNKHPADKDFTDVDQHTR